MRIEGNVLPNSPNISDLTGRKIFKLDSVSDYCKNRIKVPPCRSCQFLGSGNMLIREVCSETGAFWHSSNDIFWSQ